MQSRLLHSEIWLWATWRQEPLVQIFLQALPCFTRGFRQEEWSSGLAVCSGTHFLSVPPRLPKPHLHTRPSVHQLRPPVCKFSFVGEGVRGMGLRQSSLDSGLPGSKETCRVRNWSLRDYFRRKRCAKMAASSGLTGWASCPRRLTGGMLPNWRFVRKLLASWIVFFSSASSSCCRM